MVTDYTKQMELILPHEIKMPIHVVGCGAIGSWLTFFLLKMGFKNVHVYDFDDIEEHNLPNQFFKESDIRKPKLTAIMNVYDEYFDDLDDRLKTHHGKITAVNAGVLDGIVFCCVDSMKARKEIYENCCKYGRARLWIEGRIGLFGAYIFTVDNVFTQSEEYEATLYEDSEAEISACGVSQTALPAAVNCASLMLMQMISWHRGTDLENSIQYSIPNMMVFTKRWQ